MTYRQSRDTGSNKAESCPDCQSRRLLLKGGRLFCTNCGKLIGAKMNKYGAKRTEFKGKIYDSKFEAGVASELETRKLAGDILDYETQFRIECWAYRADGTEAFKVRHKVDFRVHNLDGSFELVEAKGKETDDYKWRRKFLEDIWLPEHKDHTYRVVKQNTTRRG